jgi:hypothetical protein
MNDSWLDPSTAPWLRQKAPGNRGAGEAANAIVQADDDPFDPWRYWEIFSGTD